MTAERLPGPLRRLWTAPRSPQAIVAVLALWLTLAANLALWRLLLRLLPGAGGALVIAGIAVVVFALTLLLFSLTAWGRAMKPIWLGIVVVAAVVQHFMLEFGVVIDATMLANVLQTDRTEARDLLTWRLLLDVAAVVALPAAWLLQVKVRAERWPRTLLRSGALAAAAAGGAVGVALVLYPALAPLVRNNLQLRYMANPVTPLASAVRLAAAPWRRPHAFLRISEGAALGPRHAPGAAPPLVVLVVGETARADHFGLNGYARDTTPELRGQAVDSFGNAWSCGTSTLASVPCMFSPLGRARFSGRADDSENLLDVGQAAGLAVLWVDNQAGCKQVCDRVASASTADLAGTSIGHALCRDGECLDEALLVGLEARLERLPAERRRNGVLLVLHMMGSHGPAYAKRSPVERKPFQPECTTTTLADCVGDGLVNAYDNSIAYTDHVLAGVIEWLKARSTGYQTAMLYVSDHGESLGEYGLYLHGIPYAFAPDAQKRVPFVLWLSDEAKRGAAIDAQCLQSRRDAAVSHDNLFHTVLGLVDVRSPTYLPELDVVRPCRKDGRA